MKPVEARSDNELIQRCLSGDQDAWKDLISRYQRLVYSIANTFCAQREDASDIFQQVWLAVFQHLSELRNVEALPAWLMTVTRRQAFAVIQAKRGSDQLDEEEHEKGTDDMGSPVSQIQLEHAIERALEQLSDRCRSLVDLLYFQTDEPSYVEIAKRMEMPVSSVGPTRARCLERLRKLLG
jgi:RNA polymerase sigma factor (sigma-70 family)